MSRCTRFLATLVAFVVICCGSLSQAQQWGNLSGRFLFDGDVPKPAKLTITKDQEVCEKEPLFDESVVVDSESKGIADVMVYLYVTRGKAPKIHPSYEETATADVKLDNSCCRFDPHVVFVRAGQTLVVGNKDSVSHNTKIDTKSNIPINPIIPAGGELKQKYSKAERLPANVSCSIHPWMNAKLMIVEHPYFATTDKEGKFTIKNLPVGELTFQVYHNKYVAKVKKEGGSAVEWRKGRVDVDVKPGDNDLGTFLVGLDQLK